MNRGDEARGVLETLERASRVRYVPPYCVAVVHLGFGHVDAALTRLDEACAARDVHLVYLPVDPKWDGLRTNPRFHAVLARCGFPSPLPSRTSGQSSTDSSTHGWVIRPLD